MEKIGKLVTVTFVSLAILFGFLGSLTAMTASAHTAGGDDLPRLEKRPAVPLRLADGPDQFGYTYQDEAEALGPTYVFSDISGTGNPLSFANDDETVDLTTSAELSGFDFRFYGLIVDTLRVGNNGAIIVNPISVDKVGYENASNPSRYLIAPWWDDWDDLTGVVYWDLQGSGDDQRLIVQWNDMIRFKEAGLGGDFGNPVTFQAILYENGNVIQFQYEDAVADPFSGPDPPAVTLGSGGTIGIYSSGTGQGLEYGYNTAVLTNGRAIRFQRSSITIAKDAVPNASHDFEFSGSNGISSTFFLQDNGTAANSETFYLVPGEYAITETVPADWELTDLTCNNTNAITNTVEARVNISLKPEDEITCIFENSRLGSITINKSADPDSDQLFPFAGDLGSFSLDDDGTQGNPFSNTVTFPDLSPTTYVVTETQLAGWGLANIDCGEADTTRAGSTAAITLTAGEHITCTFENVEESTIIIEKVTDPADYSQDFDFTTTIPTTPTFTLNPGAGPVSQTITISGLSPNSYVITESDTTADSWDLTGLTCTDGIERNPADRAASVNLAAGETVTCTFTNTKRGVITVVKDAVPDHSELFTFTSSMPDYPVFYLEDGEGIFSNTASFTVPVGLYTVAEQNVDNWDLSDIICNDSSGGSSGYPVTRTAVIDVAPDDDITCTFTNEAAPGELIVQKVTDPTSDLQVFTYTTNIAAESPFTLSTGSAPPVSRTFTISPGTYALAEDALPDWKITGSSCSDGSDVNNIEVDPNESVTCTFTNTKQGRILVEKITVPANDPELFSFTLSEGEVLVDEFQRSAGNLYTSDYLSPGSAYNITETVDSGWDLTGYGCSDNSSIEAIDLAAGETITCTFTNTKRGQIVVDKVTYPAGDDTTFVFTAGGGLSPINFGLTDEATPRRLENLLPGPGYSITETVPGNWTLADVTCTDESPWNNINLSAGEVITCTFTNIADPGTLIIKKVTPQGSYTQPFTFTANGPEEIPEFSLSTGGSDPISRTFVITPGTYSVNEALPTGWEEPEATCSDGSEVSNVGLEPGETVTCTFTNTRLARIIVDKVTDPPGDPTSFEFTLSDGVSPAPFSLTDEASAYDTDFVQPGLFSVTETPEFGWDTSAACTGDHSPDNIDLTLGGVVTCVFTNVAQPGSITVTKRALPADDTEFTFTLRDTSHNPPLIDDEFTLGNGDTKNYPDLTYGTYRLGEEIPVGSGWTPSDIVCDDDDSIDRNNPTSIILAPGEHITCVFTNTKLADLGSITIIKDAQPNNTQPFTFTGDLGEFHLVDDGATGIYSRTFLLTAGNYVITESAVSGWNLTGLSCIGDTDNGSVIDAAQRQVIVDLDVKEDIECTFSNREDGGSSLVYLPIILKNYIVQPDLVVKSFTVDPPNPGAGENVVVTIVVENIGTAATAEGFWVDFYIDPETMPDETMGQRRWELLGTTLPGEVKGLAWKVSTLLAPGNTVTLTSDGSSGIAPDWNDPEANQRWQLDPTFVTGTNNLYTYVDSFDENLVPEGEILESDESNNRASILNLGVTGVALQSDQADPPTIAPVSSRSDVGN